MKIATVCSGIGAPEKALKNLGIKYELSYFCEFDKYATKSYCAIHNELENKNLGDLTKVEIEKLPIDLVQNCGLMKKTVDRIAAMSTAKIKLQGSSYRLIEQTKVSTIF